MELDDMSIFTRNKVKAYGIRTFDELVMGLEDIRDSIGATALNEIELEIARTARDSAAIPREERRVTDKVPALAGTKGGNGVWQRIISEMPRHRVYIEPFWGRGTIAKKKRAAEVTIGCDLDPDAISSGIGSATMFQCDGLGWVEDYFRPSTLPHDSEASGVPTFCGAAWEDHFVYFDPPYLGITGYYKHEFATDAEHLDLIRVFKSLPCPAAISGYWSELYASCLSGCRVVKIPTVNRAGKKCTEVVWFNYDPPRRYHDVRFVGSGRRERERIRRRVTTWSEGLMRMSVAERQAVFEACASEYSDGARDCAAIPGSKTDVGACEDSR